MGQTTAAQDTLQGAGYDDRILWSVAPVLFRAVGLDEERTIGAFLHAARLGLFELSWNVLCPDCGGVLDAGTTLKTVNHDEYSCTLCAAGYKPTLDYYRQIFWSSGMDLPDDLAASLAKFTIDSIEVPPGAKAVLSVQVPEGFVIVFDPVTSSLSRAKWSR